MMTMTAEVVLSTLPAHTVDYLLLLAGELKVPVSINISLGTNGHAPVVAL